MPVTVSRRTLTTIVATPRNLVKRHLLLVSTLFILYLLYSHTPPPPTQLPLTPPPPTSPAALTSHHLLFSISSSATSLLNRIPYLHLWYSSPNATPSYLFLDAPTHTPLATTIPPILISTPTSHFPYTFPRGHRSAIRISRTVKDLFTLGTPSADTRWFVFGDDDTVFFVDNLVSVLSKYDWRQWYYVGCRSESYEQNDKYSFNMAFGGGGFALSAPLAKVLVEVLDDCIIRYPNLYGSDARIFACLAELGVELTHEPGFHQVDVRGDLFGMLVAHPLSPVVSLHHMDAVDPIFPGMTKIEALEHLFKIVHTDSARVLQQVVCYDRSKLLTVSVSWGYAVQVFEGNHLLPDLLSVERTFRRWRRGKSGPPGHYMFNTREYPADPCERPVIFFLDHVVSDGTGVWTNYSKYNSGDCNRTRALMKLETISIFSQKTEFSVEQVKAPRRQCCDILPSTNDTLYIVIRRCQVTELISMQG